MDKMWFVKLHRKLLDNPIASNPLLIWLFCYLLLLVSHKDHIFYLWKIRIDQKKWEAIISKKEIAKSFKISRWTLDSYLNILHIEHIINIKTTSKYTVLTIINWCKYQVDDIKLASTWTSTWHQLEHQPDTINNDNNDKQWKENIIKELSKDNTAIAVIPKQANPDIDILIGLLKQTADDLLIAYDKKQDRNFAKHILTAKEYWNFCAKIWQTRSEFAKNIMIVSAKKSYWKGARWWPMTIYKDYVDVYNTVKWVVQKEQKRWVSSF